MASKHDFTERNRKIASKRGSSWKNSIRQAKLESKNFVSPMAQARVSLGLSQVDMARPLRQKTEITYRRIEQGKALASKEKAEIIAKTLKKKVSDIFVRVDKDNFLAI